MSIKKPTKTTNKKEDSRAAQSAVDTASGTMVLDGVTYKVKGFATLQTFKIAQDEPTMIQPDGEMAVKPKVNKDGPVLDDAGNPASITVMKVVKPLTGEVGQIVCGVVLARALKEYPGGYVGKQIVVTKPAAAGMGKARPWSVVEVSI